MEVEIESLSYNPKDAEDAIKPTEKDRIGFFPYRSEKASQDMLDFKFLRVQNCEPMHFCCFKLHNL